jgi:hypothetical protein
MTHSQPILLRRIVIGVLVSIFVATVIQFVCDKYDWETSPHSLLMVCALACQDFCYWIGEWIGSAWSLLIRLKDFMYDLVVDFLPALWKVLHPISMCVFSFYYMGLGFKDYLVEFMQDRKPDWTFVKFWDYVFVWLTIVVIVAWICIGVNQMKQEDARKQQQPKVARELFPQQRTKAN